MNFGNRADEHIKDALADVGEVLGEVSLEAIALFSCIVHYYQPKSKAYTYHNICYGLWKQVPTFIAVLHTFSHVFCY